jgi:hypothetical protein
LDTGSEAAQWFKTKLKQMLKEEQN